jgi:hypothetical protein
LAASDAGNPLTGVVITNPDPDDSTTGLLPEPVEPLRAVPRHSGQHAAINWAKGDVSPENGTAVTRDLDRQATPDLARGEPK